MEDSGRQNDRTRGNQVHALIASSRSSKGQTFVFLLFNKKCPSLSNQILLAKNQHIPYPESAPAGCASFTILFFRREH
jgi:hypothetical protein